MALPTIKVKVKGMQAINAMNAKGQLLKGLNLKAAAALGRDSTIKLKPAGAFVGPSKVIGQGTGVGKGGMAAGKSKAAAVAAKGSWGYSCWGLGPWGLPLLLSTFGFAALAYYFYRQSHQSPDELDAESAVAGGAVPAV